MAVYKEKNKKYIGKKGYQWYFSVYYLDSFGIRKRKKSKKYETRRKALEEERKFLNTVKEKTPSISFEEVYISYMKYKNQEIKESTYYTKIKRIETHILPYFKNLMLDKITMRTIQEWKNELNDKTYRNRPYSIIYKKNLFIELHSILEYAVRFYNLKTNLAKQVGTFKSRDDKVESDEEKLRYITPKEYKRFISVIDDLTFKTFFAFLYYTGCRKGEVQALKWYDIDFDNNNIKIYKTLSNKSMSGGIKITNTKNRKNRNISMPTPLKKILLEHLEEEQRLDGFSNDLYVFGNVRHLSNITIDRRRNEYFDLVEEKYPNESINRITNHEFRHSHASLLISKGISVDEIAFRLGDTVDITRKVYAHFFPETQDKIIDLLNDI